MLTVSDNHIVLGGGGGGGGGGSTTFAGLSDKATADIPAINIPTATALNARELSSNKKTDVDANKTSDTFFPSVKAVFDWVSGLFVKGAASSTDNAIARFEGTTGKLLKNSSSIVITDANIIGVGTVSPAVGGLQVTNTGAAFSSIPANTSAIGNISSTAGWVGQGFVFSNAANQAFSMVLSGGTAYFGRITDASSTPWGVWDDTGLGLGETPTAKLDVNGTSRFRSSATFNGQIIDNVGSSGADGQVLKKVGGQVLWTNP